MVSLDGWEVPITMWEMGHIYHVQKIICNKTTGHGVQFNEPHKHITQPKKQAIKRNLHLTYIVLKAMAPHSSILAWTIPWTEEPGRLQSMGPLRVGHDWATSLSLFTFVYWRRKWHPTPVFLPGESQGRGSLVGCGLWGRRVGHDWSDLAAASHLFAFSHEVTTTLHFTWLGFLYTLIIYA